MRSFRLTSTAFSGLEDRVDALIAHHGDRLAEIEAVLEKSPGVSCWDITLALSWSRPFDDLPDYMQRAANGETLAHLVLLEQTRQRHPRVSGPCAVLPVGIAVARQPSL